MPTLVADFEDGIDGWYTDGSAQYETSNVHSGNGALRVDNTDTSGPSEYAINVPNGDNDLNAYPTSGDTFEFWITLDEYNDATPHVMFGLQEVAPQAPGFDLGCTTRENRSDNRDGFNLTYRDSDGNSNLVINSGKINNLWSANEYRRVVVDWKGGGGGGGDSGYVFESGESISTGTEGEKPTMFVSGEPVYDQQSGDSFIIESGNSLAQGGEIEMTVSVYDNLGNELIHATGYHESETEPIPTGGGVGLRVGSYYGTRSSAAYLDDFYILD